MGKRCALRECGQRDFLPFNCGDCGGSFCLTHRTPDAHSCDRSKVVSAPQPILLKILKRLLAEPTVSKFRRLKLAKLKGRLSAVSLLALRNYGFSEAEAGVLSLPIGPKADASARDLLNKLERAAAAVSASATAQPSAEQKQQSATVLRTSVLRAESELAILQSVSPAAQPPVLWDQHSAIWVSAGQAIQSILSRALSAPSDPRNRRVGLEWSKTGSNPIVSISRAPGALALLEQAGFRALRGGTALVVADVATDSKARETAARVLQTVSSRLEAQKKKELRARVGAIDRLAEKAKRRRRRRASQPPGGASAAGDAPGNTAEEADGARARLATINAMSQPLRRALVGPNEGRLFQCLRIEWTVANWALIEVGALLPCYSPAIIDSAGRKWRGYVRKVAPPSGGGRRYHVDMYLELSTPRRSSPARAYMRASALHSKTRCPVSPTARTHADIVAARAARTFTPTNSKWGFPSLITSNALLWSGCLSPREDKVTFRWDFAVRSLTPDEIKAEEKKTERKRSSRDEQSSSAGGDGGGAVSTLSAPADVDVGDSKAEREELSRDEQVSGSGGAD